MSRSEFDIIAHYFANSAAAFVTESVALGIGDDAAQLRLSNPSAEERLNVSMDVLVSGVHFPADADPAQIANRALAVNLSDLAAMGAKPLGFTLGLTLPDSDDYWLEKFSAGLAPLAVRYQCPLIGGNLSRGPLNIAIQVHGRTQSDGLLRSAAQVGDYIVVSGELGTGVAALASFGLPGHLDSLMSFTTEHLSSEDRAALQQAYFAPEPRIDLGLASVGIAHAGIDISDGLLADLGHICQSSGIGATLELPRLPVAGTLTTMLSVDEARLAAILGGDDYELCMTVPPTRMAALEAAAATLGIALTRVGTIEAERGIRCVAEEGAPVSVPGSAYQHFHADRELTR